MIFFFFNVMNRRGEGRRRHWEDPKDQAVPILPAAACCKLGARHAGEWCLRASWEAVSCDADYAEPRTSLRPAGFHLIKEHLSGSRFTKGRKQKNTSTLALAAALGVNLPGRSRECLCALRGYKTISQTGN